MQQIRNFTFTVLIAIWNIFCFGLFLACFLGGLTLVVFVFLYPAILGIRHGGIDTGSALGLSMIVWLALMVVAWKTGLFKLLDIVQKNYPKILFGTYDRVENYLESCRWGRQR